MRADIFSKFTDLYILNDWCEERHLPALSLEDVPHLGIVIRGKKNIPIAVALLRQAEGRLGIFDGLMTNPTISAEVRNEALDLALVSIKQVAKENGLKAIIAWVSDKNTLVRASVHGYEVNDTQKLVHLKL